jgi:hypothetical protein
MDPSIWLDLGMARTIMSDHQTVSLQKEQCSAPQLAPSPRKAHQLMSPTKTGPLVPKRLVIVSSAFSSA